MVSLRVASLFSGIGGLDLGLQQAGHRIELMVERDAHCKQVLSARFPGVALLNDVAEVLPFMLENIDCVVAGFPCNDCSCENLKRPGLELGGATRSVSHVFRLLEARRVPWLLLENVVGLLKWHSDGEQRPAIDYVVNELENLGYRWAYRVVDLLSFGTPHKRRRVFVVASLHGDPRDVLLSQSAMCSGECVQLGMNNECYECFITPPRVPTKMFSASIDLGEKRRAPCCDIMHCFTTSNGRRTCVATQIGKQKAELSMLAIEDAERLMGFPPGYTEPCYPLMRPNERAPVFDTDLQTMKRFSLLGLACSVPQSRWLGEQLKCPYNVKFTYDALATPFEKPCPGPATRDRSSKAWPLAAYNMLNVNGDPKWTGRQRAPNEVSEFPLIRGFTPLGDFLEFTKNKPVRYELREGYLRRLELAHENIDSTILAALDVKRDSTQVTLPSPSKKSKIDILEDIDAEDDEQAANEYDDDSDEDEGESEETEAAKEKRHRDENNENDLDEHGMTTHGECSWVKWKGAVRGKTMYWPCVALHPLRDHAVIPESARDAAFSTKFTEDHRLVIFFDDRRSFAWVKASEVYPFDKFYGEAMKQPVFSSKAKFTQSVESARAWCNARNLEAPVNPIVQRNNAHLFTDPSPCYECDVCVTEAHKAMADSKPQTRSRRSSGTESELAAGRSKMKSKCAQMKIIELARHGQIGATLALRKDKAVGQRIVVLWQRDNAFYSGTITAFDPHTYSFRVDYDDGDVDLNFKPWTESVMVAQYVPSNVDSDIALAKKANAASALKAKIIVHTAADAALDENPLCKKTMRRDDAGVAIQLKL